MPGFAAPRRNTIDRAPGWRPGVRVPNEYYPTPENVIHELLMAERFSGSVWEPACGDGRIARALRWRGNFVVQTDLYNHGAGQSGIDFLAERAPRARNIITNPPYGKGLADRFVEKALAFTALTGGKVAMLLNLASLCHPMRTAWWQNHPPVRIYAVDDCECWDNERFGPTPWRTNTQRYAWVIWEAGYTGPTQFLWMPIPKPACSRR
jgi:hypothetical protein